MITAESSARAVTDDFDEFFAREFRSLVVIAFGLTGRWGLAEELAQEAMLVVYRRWASVADYDDPAAFARRVVANKSVSAFRRLVAEARAVNRVRTRREPDPAGISVEDQALWDAVRDLPARQAQAVALRYVLDLDTPAIAAALACPEGTVRVLLHRARESLARTLGRVDEEDQREH